MPFRIWIAGVLLAAGSIVSVAGEAGSIDAVKPGGPGILTKCFVFPFTCRTYHHIVLPSRMAVGDQVRLSFGSSPKNFWFPVARIILKGDHCEILSRASGDQKHMDKIDIPRCYPADEGG